MGSGAWRKNMCVCLLSGAHKLPGKERTACVFDSEGRASIIIR